MQTIKGDITNVERGIIVHVCNNRGVMGAGVAKALYTKWPAVKEAYLTRGKADEFKLGTCSVAIIEGTAANPQLVVANMIAQDGYGRDGKCYLQYEHLKHCLRGIRTFAQNHNLPVYLPHRMGCGLAGGDWDAVSHFVSVYLPDATVVRKG